MIRTKVTPPTRILSKLKNRKKKTVVFTNGIFDILHAGHVRYLEKARSLGDILIVALNSDASTQRLKGPTRPVNPLKDRTEVVAALEAVSFVTWFEEDTPLNLITKILPDVLVKGGDYEVKKIVGYDIVKANGGKTKVLPFLEGRSTSKVIEKIKS